MTNVVVGASFSPNEPTAVVTQFGLAHALHDKTVPHSPTSELSSARVGPLPVSGSILRTPDFMAPAQFERKEPVAALDQLKL